MNFGSFLFLLLKKKTKKNFSNLKTPRGAKKKGGATAPHMSSLKGPPTDQKFPRGLGERPWCTRPTGATLPPRGRSGPPGGGALCPTGGEGGKGGLPTTPNGEAQRDGGRQARSNKKANENRGRGGNRGKRQGGGKGATKRDDKAVPGKFGAGRGDGGF